jgi:hypothetical protein
MSRFYLLAPCEPLLPPSINNASEEKEPAAAAGLPPEFIKGLVRQTCPHLTPKILP